jgi:hypothetical protein
LTWIECRVVSYWRAETIQIEIPSQLLRESREKSSAIHSNGHYRNYHRPLSTAPTARVETTPVIFGARGGAQAAAAITFRRRRPP